MEVSRVKDLGLRREGRRGLGLAATPAPGVSASMRTTAALF